MISILIVLNKRMKKAFFGANILLATALTGCTTILENLPGVYKIDIQQGNIVDQKMVDQIRPNMTERQVLYILGSPMLIDTFHQKRWDYLYSNQPSGEDREQKRFPYFLMTAAWSQVFKAISAPVQKLPPSHRKNPL